MKWTGDAILKISASIIFYFKGHPYQLEVIGIPIVVGLLFYAFFPALFDPGLCRAPWQDNVYMLMPLLHRLAQIIASGEYPYWFPELGGGIPLYNSPQLSVVYPFYFIGSMWLGSVLDAERDLKLVTGLHFFILSLNSYFMLRVMRVRALGALFGAMLISLSANMYNYAAWINIFVPYAWLPLVVAAIILICENRWSWSAVVLGAIAIFLLTSASPSQPLIHMFYLVAIISGYRFILLICQRQSKEAMRIAFHLIVMGVLSLLLASPVIIPAILAIPDSIRFMDIFPAVVGGAKAPFESMLLGQQSLSDLLAVLVPLKTPKIVGNGYLGIGAFFLMCLAFQQVRKYWLLAPITFVTFYFLLSTTGDHLGFGWINYHLPGLDMIREPDRHFVLFIFGASILGAIGYESLIFNTELSWEKLNKKWIICSLLLTIIGLGIISYQYLHIYQALIRYRYLVLLSFIAIAALLFARIIPNLWKYVVAAGGGLVILFVGMQSHRYYVNIGEGDYYSARNIRAHKILRELAAIEDVRHYRFFWAFNQKEEKDQLWSMNATYYGLRSFSGYFNPLPYKQFSEVWQGMSYNHYYSLLGAKYILCDKCVFPKTKFDKFLLLRDFGEFKLYENSKALPMYQVISSVTDSIEGKGEFLNLVPNLDGHKEIAVTKNSYQNVKDWLGNDETPLESYINVERETTNTRLVSVNSNKRSILVVNEFYTPDWKVTINGQQTESFPVNLNQIGIPLEKGGSLIELRYQPTLFIQLQSVKRLTLFVLVLIVGLKGLQVLICKYKQHN